MRACAEAWYLRLLRPMIASMATLALKLGAMGAAFAHGWEPLLRGGAPPHRLTMGPVQKNQPTSHGWEPPLGDGAPPHKLTMRAVQKTQTTSGCEVLGCWAAPQPCRLHTPLSAETTWWYCTSRKVASMNKLAIIKATNEEW
jgi:hypothetical protein